MLISNFWPTQPGKATTTGHCYSKQKSILAALINFNNLSTCSIMEGRLFMLLITSSHTFRIPIFLPRSIYISTTSIWCMLFTSITFDSLGIWLSYHLFIISLQCGIVHKVVLSGALWWRQHSKGSKHNKDRCVHQWLICSRNLTCVASVVHMHEHDLRPYCNHKDQTWHLKVI